MDFDQAIRKAAFEFVASATDGGTQPITWGKLQSFYYGSDRVHLVAQQGIFKPAILDLPISIRTTPPGQDGSRPYEDEISDDGFLRYKYRGTDLNHRDNRLLRRAMEAGAPLLYLAGIAKGIYDVSGAAIIEDHPASLSFNVALFPVASVAFGLGVDIESAQRHHYLAVVKRRANQHTFREVVLRAYRSRCSVCRLRHPELLDAAHILPDSSGGLPVVTNGLSMCKIHHAAFDNNIIGVRPDMVAEVRSDILAEVDGPMLEHGIKSVHGLGLIIPRRDSWRPDTEGLELRYEEFRRAG